jgi:NAD(P)-dependent dehydrogenase (short-subunit alcohol dehydrogenase family)
MIEISTIGTSKDFDSMYAVNVRGTFFCYKYAGLQMVSQGRGGRIIGASSVRGKQGQNRLPQHCNGWVKSLRLPGGASSCGYSATKFAIRGLTQSAGTFIDQIKHLDLMLYLNSASELGKYGITVNAYAPGPIDTPLCRYHDWINNGSS